MCSQEGITREETVVSSGRHWQFVPTQEKLQKKALIKDKGHVSVWYVDSGFDKDLFVTCPEYDYSSRVVDTRIKANI